MGILTLRISRKRRTLVSKLKEVFKISNSIERKIYLEYKSFQRKILNSYFSLKAEKESSLFSRQSDFIKSLEAAANELGEKEIYLTKEALIKSFRENQNLIHYNESKRNGYLLDLASSSDLVVNSVVNSAWTSDGKTYGDRIKTHKENLILTFEKEIDETITRRELPIKRIAALVGAAFYNYKRILYTEAAHVITESDKISYSGLNYEEYTFNATFDDRTSEMCAEMDGQVFKYTEMMVGLNAPPLHPNCRSTIEPITLTELHLPYKYGKTGLGERIRIPRDMRYAEFKQKYL